MLREAHRAPFEELAVGHAVAARTVADLEGDRLAGRIIWSVRAPGGDLFTRAESSVQSAPKPFPDHRPAACGSPSRTKTSSRSHPSEPRRPVRVESSRSRSHRKCCLDRAPTAVARFRLLWGSGALRPPAAINSVSLCGLTIRRLAPQTVPCQKPGGTPSEPKTTRTFRSWRLRHAARSNAAGYVRVDQLADVKEADLVKLHGMGPTAIDVLRAALKERGLSFRD